MPHTMGKELGSMTGKLSKLAKFIERLRAETLIERGLRKYLEDSTFRISTNDHGQLVFIIEFAPQTQPNGDGFNSFKHLVSKMKGHVEPIVRKGGGKHHCVFEDSIGFEIRLTFSVVIEGDDPSIENQTGGGRE